MRNDLPVIGLVTLFRGQFLGIYNIIEIKTVCTVYCICCARRTTTATLTASPPPAGRAPGPGRTPAKSASAPSPARANSSSMNTPTPGRLPSNAKFQVDFKKSWVYQTTSKVKFDKRIPFNIYCVFDKFFQYFQVVIKNSPLSSSWRDTSWSTHKLKHFYVIFVT